MMAWS